MGLIKFIVVGFAMTVLAMNGILVGVQSPVVNLALLSEIPVLEEKIKSSQFPELLIPLVKNKDFATDFAVSMMEIEHISIPVNSARFSFSNAQEIIFESSDISLRVGFLWKIQSHHKQGVLDKGFATVELEKSSISMKAQMTGDLKKMLKPVKSEFKIGDLKITFQNTFMKDMINWGLSVIKEKLVHTIEASVNSALSLGFEQYLNSLASLGSERLIDITQWLTLNATLSDLPSINENFLSLSLEGSFKHKTKDYKLPEITSKPLEYQSKRQLALYISEYSVNTLSLAYFHHGPLSISNHDLGVELKTNHLDIIFPNLTSAFGEGKAVDLVCTQVNYLEIALGSNFFSIQQRLSCLIHCESQKIAEVLIGLNSRIEAQASSGIIHGKILNIETDDLVSVEFYTQDTPDWEEIQSFLNGVLNFAKPIISFKVFGSGILIPGYIVKYFEGFEVSLDESLLVVEGDLSSHNN